MSPAPRYYEPLLRACGFHPAAIARSKRWTYTPRSGEGLAKLRRRLHAAKCRYRHLGPGRVPMEALSEDDLRRAFLFGLARWTDFFRGELQLYPWRRARHWSYHIDFRPGEPGILTLESKVQLTDEEICRLRAAWELAFVNRVTVPVLHVGAA